MRAFFGCLYAGAIAVPVYPPGRSGRERARLDAALGDSGARHVLTNAPARPALQGLLGPPDRVPVEVTCTDAFDLARSCTSPAARVERHSIAFLQYTSGSTGDPRGVVVTHGNLLENLDRMHRALGQGPDERIVSWLPLYHDMGLIGTVLYPLVFGYPTWLMSPLAFAVRPIRWLRAISDHSATTSAAPSSAYELCVARIPVRQAAALDLSRWTVACNGAEPICPATMDAFAERFGVAGFRRTSFRPCYGLAESTLMVSSGRQGRSDGRAGCEHFVSCGVPEAGTVRIVDPETGTPRPEGAEGEVWVRGPSVAAGYWRRAAETRAAFRAYTSWGEGPWLRTGDLGQLRGRHLLISGRLKDVIIVRGMNHGPQDIERTVRRAHSGFARGMAAAFAVERGRAPQLVVVQEVDRALAARIAEGRQQVRDLLDAARALVSRDHELELYDLVLVGPRAIPRTSSGKVRRRRCRELYVSAEWERLRVPSICPGPARSATPAAHRTRG